MKRYIDLKNKQFGYLKVVGIHHRIKNPNNTLIFWKCRCRCGKTISVRGDILRDKRQVSCGCKKRSHGLSHTKFYYTWRGILNRCNNPQADSHYLYGARGIKVCKRWYKFNNFKDDMYESYKTHCEQYPEGGTSIDRIDNRKGYNKNNCRWVTFKEQSNNKTNNRFLTLGNSTHTIAEWSDITGIPAPTIYARITRYNWAVKRALTENHLTYHHRDS